MIYLGFVYLHHRKLILYQGCIDSLSLAYKCTVCYIYTHIHGMYVPFVDCKTLILMSRSLLQIISDTKLFHDILVSLLLLSVNCYCYSCNIPWFQIHTCDPPLMCKLVYSYPFRVPLEGEHNKLNGYECIKDSFLYHVQSSHCDLHYNMQKSVIFQGLSYIQNPMHRQSTIIIYCKCLLAE